MVTTNAGAAPVAKRDIAGGAATVALSRLGAAIEVVSQPVYTWLFGIAGYGIYVVAWSVVNFAENILDLAFTSVLQRVVPRAKDEAQAHAFVKLALFISVVPATAVALAASVLAGPLSGLLNAAPQDRPQLALSIALFAWALPLWTLIEVATAAVRARHAFGPEVRLRIFWEQLLRLGLVGLAYLMGFGLPGLFAAHVASLAVTAGLALRLIGRYYDLGLLWRAPLRRDEAHMLLGYGFALLPGNVIRRALGDLPPVLLNAMLPGASGATAAGLYGIARKLSGIPQIVRQTFTYVTAPLAAAQARHDVAVIQPLYAFATRLSATLVLPIGAAMMVLGDDMLSLFAPGAQLALPMLIVLLAARTIEAIVGPAGPVLDILGHRRWLLINALSGLAAWLLLSVLLVRPYGGLGMALAVSAGVLVPALLALVQLRTANRLDALSPRLAVGVLVGLAWAMLFAVVDVITSPLGHWPALIVVALLLPPAIWTGLRLGLSRSDREAFGGSARRMRLL